MIFLPLIPLSHILPSSSFSFFNIATPCLQAASTPAVSPGTEQSKVDFSHPSSFAVHIPPTLGSPVSASSSPPPGDQSPCLSSSLSTAWTPFSSPSPSLLLGSPPLLFQVHPLPLNRVFQVLLSLLVRISLFCQAQGNLKCGNQHIR